MLPRQASGFEDYATPVSTHTHTHTHTTPHFPALESTTWQLIVDVVSATALSEDRSTDAFVTLKYGKSKASTAVVDDNVNPEWGEQHLFTLKEQDDQTLVVTVWDKNTMRNKCLGVAEIDLAALANFEPVDEVYPLRAAEAPEPAAPAADGGADGGDGVGATVVNFCWVVG